MNNVTVLERQIEQGFIEGKEFLLRQCQVFEERINKYKLVFIKKMREQNHFIEHCSLRGYIYEVVQSVDGLITRITVSIKNGYLSVLAMEPVEDSAA